MEVRLIVVLVFVIHTTFAAGINTECVTPNGEKATCISVRSCQVTINAILTNSSNAINFAKQSQCGYDKEPLVCCGLTGYSTTPSIFDIFKKPPDGSKPVIIEKVALATPTIKDQLPSRSMCGLGSESYKILGGEIVALAEFPWVALLEYNGTRTGIRCGGSVINSRYILTAADCIVYEEPISVRLGEWKFSTNPDCESGAECADNIQSIQIEKQILHNLYNKTSRENNIALLKLQDGIRYTEYIRPICMPEQNSPQPAVGTSVTVVGWGVTGNGYTSDYKSREQLPVRKNEECSQIFKNQLNATNQLCAAHSAKTDSCVGDLGGPLMRAFKYEPGEQEQWYQEGVIFWNGGCGGLGHPTYIYTPVTRYMDWIINNINEN